MKTKDITSIGWLQMTGGRIRLVACTRHNSRGVQIIVDNAEFQATNGDKDRLKELFVSKSSPQA